MQYSASWNPSRVPGPSSPDNVRVLAHWHHDPGRRDPAAAAQRPGRATATGARRHHRAAAYCPTHSQSWKTMRSEFSAKVHFWNWLGERSTAVGSLANYTSTLESDWKDSLAPSQSSVCSNFRRLNVNWLSQKSHPVPKLIKNVALIQDYPFDSDWSNTGLIPMWDPKRWGSVGRQSSWFESEATLSTQPASGGVRRDRRSRIFDPKNYNWN